MFVALSTLRKPVALHLLLAMIVSGCAAMSQDSKTVLIREPGNRTYNPPVDLSSSAKELWEYAVLSENVYVDGWGDPQPRPAQPRRDAERLAAYLDVCPAEGRLPLADWQVWDDFPSEGLREKARQVGLYMEVWEKPALPPIVAVVFRGTEFFSWHDWFSNFRWFNWLLRFLPSYRDQYTVVARDTGEEVLQNLKRRIERGMERYKDVRMITTGHSLGGGLAQHLAYSLPEVKSPAGALLPRVSSVHAFDPSPVTGWYSIDGDLRKRNSTGLKIDRIFEHGEILAYARWVLGYLNPPSAADPAIRQLRYNFVESINPFSSHSMRLIACALLSAAQKSDK